MIWPNAREIFKHYPYLLPVLILLLAFMAWGWMWDKIIYGSACPGCHHGKKFCIVACERVSRQLDEADEEVEHGWS